MKRTSVDDAYVKDTGVVFSLAALVGMILTDHRMLLFLAVGLLSATALTPWLVRPIATLWHRFSLCLAGATSRLVLTLVFFVVVTPAGMACRVLGRDPLKLRQFGRQRGSMLVDRQRRFSAADLEHPY